MSRQVVTSFPGVGIDWGLIGGVLGFLLPVLVILVLGIFLVRISQKSRRRMPKLRGGETKKNPGVAVVLSFFYCGLGHLYNGQIVKGVLYMLFYGISIGLAISLIFAGIWGPVFFLLLFAVLLWIEGMIGANETARKINILLDYLEEKGLSTIRDADFEIDVKRGRIIQKNKEADYKLRLLLIDKKKEDKEKIISETQGTNLCVNCRLSGDCKREKKAKRSREIITDCRGYFPRDK